MDAKLFYGEAVVGTLFKASVRMILPADCRSFEKRPYWRRVCATLSACSSIIDMYLFGVGAVEGADGEGVGGGVGGHEVNAEVHHLDDV